MILVHGWGGRAGQMAPLAVSLADRGYRAVALDITGHGDTQDRITRWHYFVRDIEALAQSLQSDIHACIGHSSGGTTMMALQRQGRISAKRYVCICSPSYPFLAIDSLRNTWNPSERIVNLHEDYLANAFGIVWDDLRAGGCFSAAGKDLLLIYDERDRLVPHSEGDRIHVLCPGSALIKTGSYGHRKILTAPELATTINDFLK